MKAFVPVPYRPLLYVADPQQQYQSRPGAYGIIFDTQRRVLVIEEDTGFFLPGGGQDPGEDLPTTLRREIDEELGAGVAAFRYLLAADDCRFSPVYQRHFRIEGHYFLVQLQDAQSLLPEPGAQLHWLPVDQAIECLNRYNEKWQLRQFSGEIQINTQIGTKTETNGYTYALMHNDQFDDKNWIHIALHEQGFQVQQQESTSQVNARRLLDYVQELFIDS